MTHPTPSLHLHVGQCELWYADQRLHADSVTTPRAVGSRLRGHAASHERSRMKRTVDLIVSLALLVVLSPVLVACLIVSALVFRAPPLFTQPRLGRGGSEFRFHKIRSLPADTRPDAGKYELKAVQVPAWGRFLRRTHLDELPQLSHVVSGRMSLVGPRPEMPSLSATFDPEFVRLRLTVRPGITGLWQVSKAASSLIGEHPEFDLFYLEHRSAALNVWILWRTALGIFGGSTIGLDDVPLRCAMQDPKSRHATVADRIQLSGSDPVC